MIYFLSMFLLWDDVTVGMDAWDVSQPCPSIHAGSKTQEPWNTNYLCPREKVTRVTTQGQRQLGLD